jgi:hypothetical protein
MGLRIASYKHRRYPAVQDLLPNALQGFNSESLPLLVLVVQPSRQPRVGRLELAPLAAAMPSAAVAAIKGSRDSGSRRET